jgi:hypothetical protein
MFGQGGAAFRLPAEEVFHEGLATGLQMGGATNIRIDAGSKTKWLVGGGAGFSVSPNVQIVGEYDRIRLTKASLTFVPRGSRTDATASATARVDEFTAGVHYLFTPKSRVVPYASVAGGIARLSGSGEVPGLPSFSASESQLTTNFGGGIRIYGGRHWGLRPDFRVVRVPGQTYFRAAVAVFAQLGGTR